MHSNMLILSYWNCISSIWNMVPKFWTIFGQVLIPETNRNQRKPTETNRNQWKPTATNGNLRKPAESAPTQPAILIPSRAGLLDFTSARPVRHCLGRTWEMTHFVRAQIARKSVVAPFGRSGIPAPFPWVLRYLIIGNELARSGNPYLTRATRPEIPDLP